jgi:hypothetical protein
MKPVVHGILSVTILAVLKRLFGSTKSTASEAYASKELMSLMKLAIFWAEFFVKLSRFQGTASENYYPTKGKTWYFLLIIAPYRSIALTASPRKIQCRICFQKTLNSVFARSTTSSTTRHTTSAPKFSSIEPAVVLLGSVFSPTA